MASIIDWIALGILSLGSLSGYHLGIRRQLICSGIMYTAAVFAFQLSYWLPYQFQNWVNVVLADAWGSVLPGFDAIPLVEGTKIVVSSFVICVLLLLVYTWTYEPLRPLKEEARRFDKLAGVPVGLLQGWSIIVLLGIAIRPFLSYLATRGSYDWQYTANWVETTITWQAVIYSANVLVPLIRFWLPGMSPYLLTFWA